MIEWALVSNSGLQLLKFHGKCSSSIDGWIGTVLLSSDDHKGNSKDILEPRIWQMELKQFLLSREDLVGLRNGLKNWTNSSYQSGFSISHSCWYYHEILFELHAEEPLTGKATFTMDGESWGLTNIGFQMITDQSCVSQTLDQMNNILNEGADERVYVRLLGEGTETFRPTKSKVLAPGIAEIVATEDYDSEDEEWEFKPGSIVKLSFRFFDKEKKLVAVDLVKGVQKN